MLSTREILKPLWFYIIFVMCFHLLCIHARTFVIVVGGDGGVGVVHLDFHISLPKFLVILDVSSIHDATIS